MNIIFGGRTFYYTSDTVALSITPEVKRTNCGFRSKSNKFSNVFA